MKDFNLINLKWRSVKMMNIDKFPKSIKKTVRYIKQEATKEQLEEVRKAH